MAKSRGADAPKQESQEISTEKFLNLGVEVTLRSLGTVKVKELSFSNLVSILAKAAAVLADTAKSDNANFLASLTGNEQTQGLLQDVFSAATGRAAEDFHNLPASDGLRLIAAVNEVNDFAEIFSVFQEMGLQKILSAFTEQKSQTE